MVNRDGATLQDVPIARKKMFTWKLSRYGFHGNQRGLTRSDSQPSQLESDLGYWLRSVSNAVSRSFARKVEGEGVTVAEGVFLQVI